ncbi:MAG: hypothetical protein IKU45_06840 [Clostridia bacterium]|nr:hypothetical protein [Clostridia bacterium]
MSEYQNYDDYTDPDEINEFDAVHTDPNKITFGRVLKKTFFFTLRVIAVVVVGLLFWRIFSSGDTKLAKSFLWNESAISSYTENADEFSAFCYKRPDNYTKDGKFQASNVYFVPSTGQFQITVRYNNSTLKKLVEDYSLKETPTGEVFVFTLTDNLGNVYTSYQYATDSKNLYNYRRVVFDNIDMNAKKTVEEDGVQVEKFFEELYVNVYYIDDVTLSNPYGQMTVYDTKYYHEPVDLSKYPITDNAPSKELTVPPSYTVKAEPDSTDTAE